MKTFIFTLAVLCLSTVGKAQSVIASGQQPAWTLEWDGTGR